MIRRLLVAGGLAFVLCAPGLALASAPHASLTDVENDVMCVVCNEPLAVSTSPEADRERAFIEKLIAQGDTKSQIEHQLVIQYTAAVLGRPPAHGFNLTVYVLPPAIVGAGILVLALTLPRWRRRSRAARAEPLAVGAPLDPAEDRRLEEELSRYGG